MIDYGLQTMLHGMPADKAKRAFIVYCLRRFTYNYITFRLFSLSKVCKAMHFPFGNLGIWKVRENEADLRDKGEYVEMKN